MRNAYKMLVGKRQETNQETWCRWEDNIRMDLRETGWEGTDLIHLAQDRDQWRDLVYVIMNLRVP
jgi:hypothetical protein